MRTCYLVGAGEFYGTLSPTSADLVIAADGGYETLQKIGITPDLLIGDMDSLSICADGTAKISYPVKKDETDTHLSYLEGARRGYSNFAIYGGVGGREDHTFANYSLLLYAKNQGHHASLIGNKTEIFVIRNEKISLCGMDGDLFSVFAFGSDAKGVSVRGGEYEAEDVTLKTDFALGVSNAFTNKPVEIEVKDGALLVMATVRNGEYYFKSR